MSGYRRIAEAMKMEGHDNPKADVLRLVRNWLCDELNGQWVMVIDNADDSNVLFPPCNHTRIGEVKDPSEAEEPLSDFIPQSPNGSVLVTSRSRDVAYKLTGSNACIIEITPMDRNDAMILFRNILGSRADQDDATRLLEALDYMPLAITQAAAYIEQRAPRMTIPRYLSDIRTGGHDRGRLLMEDVGDYRRNARASNSILKTWQILYEYIRKHKPAAARLLSLISFFDNQGTPESLLRGRYQAAGVESNFEEDIHILVSYSLVRTSEKDDELEMHRLVQFSTRKWLELYDEVAGYEEIFLTALDEALPNGAYTNWKACEKLLPHAEIAVEYESSRNELFRQWGSILRKAAYYTSKKGQYSRAEEMNRHALNVNKRILKSEHLDTVKGANYLASVLRIQGKHEEAEEIYRYCLNVTEKKLGPEHPETVVTVGNLGLVLSRQGKYEDAKALNRRALERFEQLLGLEHLYTLDSVGDLALALADQAKYEDAETVYQRSLAGYEKVLGPEHRSTLTHCNFLRSVLVAQGKYKNAEAMYQRSLEGFETVLRPKHPHTLISCGCLALVLTKQGMYEEGEAMARRSVETSNKVLGLEHPRTLLSVNVLEEVLRMRRT
ncbi:hypothetical protein SLS60_009807 [Paraconiothyrium brasiliense]|uniref:DUF7779 domain-containing protein n=1 Tax=Paraconiothyrium brasiliense TaxID=300254 RepID=A0ABR3QSJ3_9PLEO